MDPKRRLKKQKVITDGRLDRFEFAVKKKGFSRTLLEGVFFDPEGWDGPKREPGDPRHRGPRSRGGGRGRGNIYRFGFWKAALKPSTPRGLMGLSLEEGEGAD